MRSRTLLGFVEAAALHVHLAELHDGRLVNPLLPGHLEPYVDRTAPTVTDLEIRDAADRLLPSPFVVCGIVSLAAAAQDRCPCPARGRASP